MNAKEEKLKLKNKLKASKKEMMCLLYGERPNYHYPWGETKKHENEVVAFMNELLGETPLEFWPEDEDVRIKVTDGNWRLKIFTDEGEQHADLKYAKDDHTAWVVRGKNGKFKNFDIGGS